MSQMISTVATGFPLLAASDGRAVAEEFADNDGFQPAPLVGLLFTLSDVLPIDDFSTEWWPMQGLLLGDTGLSDVQTSARFQRVYPVAGANGRFSFAGITRDAYGSPLAGCTVRCFRVLDSSLQAIVVSDAGGNYIATTPYNDSHFLTVHYGGTVAGASVDTITPS